MFTVITTIGIYAVALHFLRRCRDTCRPGKVRTALDATLRVMGGGGGPVEPF